MDILDPDFKHSIGDLVYGAPGLGVIVNYGRTGMPFYKPIYVIDWVSEDWNRGALKGMTFKTDEVDTMKSNLEFYLAQDR